MFIQNHWFNQLSLLKRILGFLFIFLLISLGLFRFRNTGQPKEEFYTVKRGDISEAIIISGNVNISGNASVYSSSTGIVEEVYVTNGERVTEGQELLKIKSTATDIEKSNALATYQAAVSAVNTAKQAKVNNQSLLEAGRKAVLDASISLQQLNERRSLGSNNPTTNKQYSQDEIDSITSTYTSSKKSFESLEKKYLDSDSAINAALTAATAAKYAYQATLNGVIKAPIMGVVTNMSVGKGDAVSVRATSTLTSETIPVLRITTIDQPSVVVKLSEIDITKIVQGLSVSVVFDAIPEKIFPAELKRIDSVGVNENAVVTYNAYISINDTDDRIRPAMTATVTIKTEPKKNVLLVPNTALTKENNKIVVRIKNDKSITTKQVVVGIKNTLESEILEGISDGDVLVIDKK